MAGNSIWKGWTGSPKDVGWGSWAEGWGPRIWDEGPGMGVCAPKPAVLLYHKPCPTLKTLIPRSTLIPDFMWIVVALHPIHPLALRC